MPVLPAILAAVPAVTSLWQGARQGKELNRIKEQGPAPISPYLQAAVNQSRAKAGVTMTDTANEEKDALDRNIAATADIIRTNASNSAEALSGIATLEGKRGEALNRLYARNDQVREQRGQNLIRSLYVAGQQDNENKLDYLDEIYNLTQARDTNLLNAPVHAANAVLQGAGDEEFLSGGLFAGMKNKKKNTTTTNQ